MNRLLVIALALLLFNTAYAERYLKVSQRDSTVYVIDNGQVIQQFDQVAFGLRGVQDKLAMGDDITPAGEYRITQVRGSARFNTFIALNYPNMDDATRGLRSGVIDQNTWIDIKTAHDQGKAPPQTTALGGHIGIHGLGRGDIKIHRQYNWTQGCVALTNEQINTLARLARPGMKVIIEP